MDVIEFYNQYSAGRTTLGQTILSPPLIISYLYRAFPARSGFSLLYGAFSGLRRSPNAPPIIQ
jgi:hypothetical protein